MARRKAGTKVAGDADKSPAAKKKCLSQPSRSSQIDEKNVRLEWEGDKGSWTQFARNIHPTIVQAFNEGDTAHELEFVSGPMLAVKFDTMVQQNKKTGWERRVRCCVKDSSDEVYYAWQWEDEKARWNPYGIQESIDLEAAHQAGEDTIDLDISGRAYSVDLKSLEQTNTATKVTRKIARIKSDAEEQPDVTLVDGAAGDASKSSGKRGRSAKVKKEEPDTEDDKKVVSKGRSTASKSRGKAKFEEGGEEVRVRTMNLAGSAPVDAECTVMINKAHVLSEGKNIWDCMLNQTNVSNNNNKYYLIQLLEENTKKAYHVWQRWGRVGYNGQTNLVPCGTDLDKAKSVFMKKFSDKTKNNWANRNKFVKVPGKYDLLEMDYSPKDELDAGPSSSASASASLKRESSFPESKISKSLQDLMNLICDIKLMEEAVVEMKYDAKKAPLGKLTTDQIKAGYAALKKIDMCIEKKDFGRNLTESCDEFYTRIPHNFGMRQPPLIREKHTVEQKMQLLEALGDIEIAIKTLKKGDMSENPVDRHYHALDCLMEPLGKTTDEFKIIENYLQNTHASTHNQYKLEIIDAFHMEKSGEAEQFTDFGNRMLLWHGSRITNWVGILSKGLRIAPPEAPVTGYMFGKGVYFADMSSKSANYCFATRSKNIGILLLSEVSLGNTNDLMAADYKADQLPPGKQSVKGVGSIAPDPNKVHKMENGTVVPLGKGRNTNVVNPHGYTLNYNEFIVYDTRQIKMKYLLKIRFNFK